MESPLSLLRMHWDHEPVGTARCAVRAACSGATIPPTASRAETSQRDVLGTDAPYLPVHGMGLPPFCPAMQMQLAAMRMQPSLC